MVIRAGSAEDVVRPGWRPKLVALDIDGTVVDHAGRLPLAVFDAVQRALAAGARVILSTGRGWQATRPVHDALRLPPGPAISSNGAVIVRYPPTHILREVTFDPRDVIAKVAELAPNALIATEVIGTGYRISAPFPEGDLEGELIQESLEELMSVPVTRVIVRDPNSSDRDFLALAERLGLHGVQYFIGYSAWLDIAPEGVHKGAAVGDVAARLGIAREDVLAMGDGRNDIEMLRWAGRGVAMGDAPPEVQQAADVVTDLFADNGTAKELNRWFGEAQL